MRPIICLAFAAALIVPDLARAQSSAAPILVRAGEHGTYDRLVFDWPAQVPYRITHTPGRATVTFGREAPLDLSRFHRRPPALAPRLNWRPTGNSTTVDIDIPRGAGLRHFEDGTYVALDVYESAAAAEAATIGRLVPMTSMAAVPAPQVAAPAVPPKPQVAVKPAPAPASKPQQAQVAQAQSPAPEKIEPKRSRDSSSVRGFTLGPNISTLGLGGEAGYRFNDFFGVRAGGNYYADDFSHKYSGIDYDADVTLASAGAVVDVYPFGAIFRLTGGVRYNANEIELSTRPANNINIGGVTFTPAEVGRVDAEVDFRDIAPYAGIGFEGRVFGGRLVLAADFGAFFQGSPTVDMEASGTLSNNATFLNAAENEADDLEDDLAVLGIYPVIGVSATYHF